MESETVEAKTPATTLRASEVIVLKCNACGAKLDTPMPDCVAKWGGLCDACSDKQRAEDDARIKREAEIASLEGWRELCPEDFRECDPKKLPLPRFLPIVLRWPYGPRGLILHGSTGKGKSRCAWQLIKREYERGRRIVAVDHSAAYDYMAQFDRTDGRMIVALWIERLSKVSLLLLDDVFKAKFTDSFEQALFTIVSARCERKLPIIVTTNDVGESLAKRMSTDRGTALVRRLRDHCEVIAFV